MKNRKTYILLLFLLASNALIAAPEDSIKWVYFWRHITVPYQNESVDILVKSKQGEENIKKPILLFDGGSLPRPLIILLENEKPGSVFPFYSTEFLNDFHLLIIGKPYTPLVCDVERLDQSDYTYRDPESGQVMKGFRDRDYVDYYVERNLNVLDQLKSIEWLDFSKVVMAGHSAGGPVAVNMAHKSKLITHLILSSSSHLGRMMTMVTMRRHDGESDSLIQTSFDWWESVVNDPEELNKPSSGDSNKNTYSFSQPYISELRDLTIPVLVTYGSKGRSVYQNDYLRLDMISEKKTNVTFKCYDGVEHNYATVNEAGEADFSDRRNWDMVAKFWYDWVINVSKETE